MKEKKIVFFCKRCGHTPCEYCNNGWCDTLIKVKGKTELCCDGECLVAKGVWNKSKNKFEEVKWSK